MEKSLILGRYRVLQPAGSGASGKVDVAFDERMRRRVAIKRIPLSKNPEAREKGLAEARTAAMLAHRNIVQVFDFEADSDNAYLIMEYVDGPTLAELFEAAGREFSLDELACVAKSVASALDFAHKNMVLHLDIKPANILVGRSGECKVADFGIAQLGTLSGWEHASAGTPGYMPPEQINRERLDERADEWALACILYQLISGENPFRAPTPAKSLALIEEADVLPPSAIRDDIPYQLDEVLLDALSPSRDVRFASVADFARELQPLLGNPSKGRRSFAALIEGDDEYDEDADGLESSEQAPRARLWAGLDANWRKHIARAVMTTCGTWVALISLIGAEGLPEHVSWVAACAVLLSGLFAPTLSSVLCLAALASGLAFKGMPILAALIAFAGAVWWLFASRKDAADTAVVFASPALCALYLFPLPPLLAGFARRPRLALADTALAAAITLSAGALTGAERIAQPSVMPGGDAAQALLALASSPQTWVCLCGWLVASLIMSLFCTRGSKALATVGAFIGSLVACACAAIANSAQAGYIVMMPETVPLIEIVASLLVMFVLAMMGAPAQEAGEYAEE